ncbi:hypothetical protein [Salarchaeum sp. JOR-1]|uniref:hypothetical protein n=1 Tax=Salarchaeum sp. JOR-1 TaxID=2599399 RepID=UPI00119843F1|nr:hypothetical protein [Salarchaeum sp. JOR-1]QDX41130.1 hypothetical protein FQU85_09535 [Salarchaeum sp. JOR-1]
MSETRRIHRILSVAVYFAALTLGSSILVVNPVRPLVVVPLLSVVVLLGHAVKTNHLDQIGYATMWLWVFVLGLSVGGLAVEAVLVHREIQPLVDIPVARVLGTVVLLAVPVTSYLRGVQKSRRKTTPDPTTRTDR